MTRREELREAYEDAYFALLMDEVAEMEGARWEARLKELENDPSAVVPESVDRKCLQVIDRCFARKKRQKRLRTAGKVLNRIAVLVAIVSVLFTTVMAVSADIRVATLNLLITINERYTEMRMGPEEVDQGENSVLSGDNSVYDYFSKIYIGWIPEGFSYSYGVPDKAIELRNAEELSVSIGCFSASSPLRVDTEEADSIENIEINGHNVLKILKHGYTHLVLTNEEKELFIDVIASKGVSSEVAIKIIPINEQI